MIDPLLSAIRCRFDLSETEERGLLDVMTETLSVGADRTITREGEPQRFSLLIAEGFACRSKCLDDGSRQIMEISLPGDFVDLHSYPLQRLDHDVTSFTPCTLMKLPHDAITDIIAEMPRLGRILWFFTMVDASIHREWLVSLGRRSARERVAHLLCEVYHRLRVVGLTDGTGYAFPLTQLEMCESLGLSTVHLNHMLRALREAGLVTMREGRVTIHDLDGLEKQARFDPGYLFLDPRDF